MEGRAIVSPAARLVGIDLARLVAVVGMMAAHTMLLAEPAPPDAVVALVDGPPSTLFAVLGGVSVVLAARQRLAAGDRRGAVASTLVRGAVVAMLGIVVAPLASAVFVVLVPFGVAIAISGAMLLLPSWSLGLALAVLWAVGGSVVAIARERFGSADDGVLEAALGVVLTGVYPVVTWLAYLLVGMLVARALLAARAAGTERRALVLIALVGAALLAAAVATSEIGVRLVAERVLDAPLDSARDTILANGYGAAPGTDAAWQLVAAPHTGTPTDMARTVGIALLVIGALGLLSAALPRRALRAIEPLRAAGAAPLTIYVVHVVLVALLVSLPGTAAMDARLAWAVQVAVAIAIGALLAATGSRGPLERMVGWFADRAPQRSAA
ncbi:heparan-alpha-glucosaminide N-acetyltransferase domain-containing protein [Agrococcus sp. HG114]|uniref:heparan-alpha-glucosaminide N-acetyltransferase domain-containing protein n=1 Tax=Agrococcus sp. HG114 TaxID=2969757 RepID=UPI00215A7785|nr:heparan-alpha-glucosaminide N-acetyltransferase domain-containing protein [Agrococcus sp. HG114]MCR8670669.1 heparan-alpha-glucosaminide N-acetyltransferase domain-containing protein [Agrococcus sp. HG114]